MKPGQGISFILSVLKIKSCQSVAVIKTLVS